MITPDSAAVAVAQGQGIAILPLQSQAKKPLDFLPQFGMVLDFARDGSEAAMVKFNSDSTLSIFVTTKVCKTNPTQLARFLVPNLTHVSRPFTAC
jgi:hypothetical protein